MLRLLPASGASSALSRRLRGLHSVPRGYMVRRTWVPVPLTPEPRGRRGQTGGIPDAPAYRRRVRVSIVSATARCAGLGGRSCRRTRGAPCRPAFGTVPAATRCPQMIGRQPTFPRGLGERQCPCRLPRGATISSSPATVSNVAAASIAPCCLSNAPRIRHAAASAPVGAIPSGTAARVTAGQRRAVAPVACDPRLLEPRGAHSPRSDAAGVRRATHPGPRAVARGDPG